jgi:hypothetical protein
MTDGISIVMFIVPMSLAILFSLMTIITMKNPDYRTVMASIIASISWSIFALTWPALATMDMFVSVAYLFYALSIIFAVFAVAFGLRMMGAIFETKEQPRLRMVEDNDND